MTIERARDKAREITTYARDAAANGLAARRGSTSEVPFSRGAKKVFEAALNESRGAGLNYISPEHIAVAVAATEVGRCRFTPG